MVYLYFIVLFFSELDDFCFDIELLPVIYFLLLFFFYPVVYGANQRIFLPDRSIDPVVDFPNHRVLPYIKTYFFGGVYKFERE